MKCVTSRVLTLGEPWVVRAFVALASTSFLLVASLLVASCASSETVDAVLCTTDDDCRTGCATVCGDDPFLSSDCDEERGVCACKCDTSGSGGSGGGSGGSSGSGGSAGSGGSSGGGGMGGASGDLCGADQECTASAPSICGTICIDPICGGIDNFDTAACQDGRCICICVAGDCSAP